MRELLGFVYGLLVFCAVALASVAGVVVSGSRDGLSNRTNDGLTVFLIWVGGMVSLGILLPALFWAARERVGPKGQPPGTPGPHAPP